MQTAWQIVITPEGIVRCLYDEALDLHALGRPVIRRGSHVEPTAEGRWTADLAPVGGPLLGPFRTRSEALTAERQWLERHWLASPVARSVRSPAPQAGPHTDRDPARRAPGLERL